MNEWQHIQMHIIWGTDGKKVEETIWVNGERQRDEPPTSSR